jgi:hypothetical protein
MERIDFGPFAFYKAVYWLVHKHAKTPINSAHVDRQMVEQFNENCADLGRSIKVILPGDPYDITPLRSLDYLAAAQSALLSKASRLVPGLPIAYRAAFVVDFTRCILGYFGIRFVSQSYCQMLLMGC